MIKKHKYADEAEEHLTFFNILPSMNEMKTYCTSHHMMIKLLGMNKKF